MGLDGEEEEKQRCILVSWRKLRKKRGNANRYAKRPSIHGHTIKSVPTTTLQQQ